MKLNFNIDIYITKENGKLNYQFTSSKALSLLVFVCVI